MTHLSNSKPLSDYKAKKHVPVEGKPSDGFKFLPEPSSRLSHDFHSAVSKTDLLNSVGNPLNSVEKSIEFSEKINRFFHFSIDISRYIQNHGMVASGIDYSEFV